MARLKKVILVLLGGYVLISTALYFFQESLIFLPSHLAQDYEYRFMEPAKEFNLKNEGIQLNGVHFRVKNSKGVILYFHGNAGDLSRWGEVVQPLLKFGYDIIVMDYRGYGKNGGEFSESAMYADAQVFYDDAKQEYAEDKIIVYGRSLGTTFATYLASQNKPGKLILETPFYSISSVAKSRFPFLPIDWLLNYKFETHKFVQEVNCPSLIVLSGKDEVIPYENGLQLSKEFKQVKTVTIANAGHNNVSQHNSYWMAMEEFLKGNSTLEYLTKELKR